MDLQGEYFWATECNLVTLHELLMLSTASKKMIKRQKQICVRMLRVCHDELFQLRKKMSIEDFDMYYAGALNGIPRIKKIMELNDDSGFFDESSLERWAQIIVAAWEPANSTV